MNKFDYVKVLLYAYPKLDALADAIESGTEVKALLSFRGRGDAIGIAEKIAEEIVTAKKLSLLKRELDDVLTVCNEREMFLLEYKYFRRKAYLKGKFAGFAPKYSERNYFRKQNALLSKIAARLLQFGWSEERFLSEFQANKPFMRVFRAVREGRERAVVFKRRKRGIDFLRKGTQNSDSSCGTGAGLLPRRTKTAIAASASPAAQIIAICRPESPDCGASTVPLPPSSSPDEGRK